MRYDSFRLRVWRGTRHDRVQWSARLEGLQDGVEFRFNAPDALFAHLRTVLDVDAPTEIGQAGLAGGKRPE
jgi:hypothetical protein